MTFHRAPLILLALLILPPAEPALAAPATPEQPAPSQSVALADAPATTPLPLLEITTSNPGDRRALARLDLDLVAGRPGAWAHAIGWPGTIERLDAAGLTWRIVEQDYGAALARDRTGVPAPGRPGFPEATPPVGSGSLGGFYDYAEVNAIVNNFAANDVAGIVSEVETIGTSLQGRPIRAIRIGSDAQPADSRPRVLFTALTHAREPGGMQVLLHFMEQLINGYGTDPNLTYLVNEREIWFVPLVNPDGYVLNQNTWTSTGSFGLWRKNLRDNNSDGATSIADGVDLNRNFGFQWGYDNLGSSPTFSNQTYRGTGPFSEPETVALRNFSIQHEFATANNFHTFGELCLYPWGYIAANSPDSAWFIPLTEEMMEDADYTYGYSTEVLYPVNGDANDWMYGDVNAKPKAMAVTTEVGDQNDGFWPPQNRIAVLAASQDRANRVLAYAAGVYVTAGDPAIVTVDGWWHPGLDAEIAVTLTNKGLLPSDGALTATATTTVAGITLPDDVSTFPPLASGESAGPLAGDGFTLNASASVPPGTRVPIVLTITDAGAYVLLDTVTVTVGEPVVAFADDGSAGLAAWTTSGTWGMETDGGDDVFSDSPAGDYPSNASAALTLDAPLDLSGGAVATLTFRHTYEIEGGYDAGRAEISTDGGGSWIALPGVMTRGGHGTTGNYAGGTQPAGQPCYDATQRVEAAETIDLTPWAGLTDVRLRFRFTSDSSLNYDGWRIDDVAVLVYPVDVSAVADGVTAAPPRLSAPAPNPFAGGTRLTAAFDASTHYRAAVYTADGRLVRILAEGFTRAGSRDLMWDGRKSDGTNAASGAYFIQVESDRAGSVSRKVIRIR